MTMIMMEEESEYSTQRYTLMCRVRPSTYFGNTFGELTKKWKNADNAMNAATAYPIFKLNKLMGSEKLPVPGASVR